MTCPCTETKVLETRPLDGARWRRRKCLACGAEHWTEERPAPSVPAALHILSLFRKKTPA